MVDVFAATLGMVEHCVEVLPALARGLRSMFVVQLSVPVLWLLVVVVGVVSILLHGRESRSRCIAWPGLTSYSHRIRTWADWRRRAPR